MPSAARMRHLTTVRGSFHGRLIAARLGAEGVLVELRGLADGPYPLLSAVEVYVAADQLELAREILLADAVDAAVDDQGIEAELAASPFGLTSLEAAEPAPSSRRERSNRVAGRIALAALAVVLVVALLVGILAVVT